MDAFRGGGVCRGGLAALASLVLLTAAAWDRGTAAALPASITLTNTWLDGTNGVLLAGGSAGGYSGVGLSSAGDVNGDGYDDVLVSAKYARSSGHVQAGETYLMYGRAGGWPAQVTLSNTWFDGVNGVILGGGEDNLCSGGTVKSAGDVNGDGYDDLLVAASTVAPGKIFLVYGRPNLPAYNTLSAAWLDGTNGVYFEEVKVGFAGSGLASAGDVNGDGLSDILIGAPYVSSPAGAYVGETYLVYGRTNLPALIMLTNTWLNGTNGVILTGMHPDGYSGSEVSSAGDVNKDGLADILVGAYGALSYKGEAYLVYGRTNLPASITLTNTWLNGTNGVLLAGAQDGFRCGVSLNTAGDVNGDGYWDFLVGASYASPPGLSSAGEVYLVYGRAGLPASITLASAWLNGTNGVLLAGARADDSIGSSVATAGDVSGDGHADFLVGAVWPSPSGRLRAGETYLVYGRAGLPASITTTSVWLNATNGVLLAGARAQDFSGYNVASAGDVNADAYADILVSAPMAMLNVGEAYLVFGRPGPPPPPRVLGTNGASLASGEAASAAKGTAFGSVLVGRAVTNRLTLTNLSPAQALSVSGVTTSGAGAACFQVLDMPSTLAARTAAVFRVVFTPAARGTATAAVTIAHGFPGSPHRLHLAGQGAGQSQTITFPSIPDQYTNSVVRLGAAASSGLPVTFTVAGGPGAIAGGTNLSFTGPGTVRVAASQAGNATWEPAPAVTNFVLVALSREAKRVASDGLADDLFGFSVSLAGDRIAVGAPWAVGKRGATYIFERNQGGVDAWGQTKKITVPGAAVEDGFGMAVALDGETLVSGATGELTYRGSAYVLARNQGGVNAWGQIAKLAPSDGADHDNYGMSVALSSNRIAVGSGYHNGFRGAVYLYERDQGGSNAWGLAKKVALTNGAADVFGWSVSLRGDWLVVGATGSEDYKGAAYIFSRNEGGANAWGQVKKLTASDGESMDYFGADVALDGDTVVVGTSINGTSNRCAAYVFQRDQGGANAWGQVAKLTASDRPEEMDLYGDSVAIDGDTVLVGARWNNDYRGAVYVYSRHSSGINAWGQTRKWVAAGCTTNDCMGRSVAIEGNVWVAGATGRNQSPGAVFVLYGESSPGILVLGTNGAALASGAEASLNGGTAFGSSATHTLTITNSSTNACVISSATLQGADAACFQLAGMPAYVAARQKATFRITYAPGGYGTHAAAVYIWNSSLVSPYVVNVSGASYASFSLRAVALTNNVVLRWPDPCDVGLLSREVRVRAHTDHYPANLTDGVPVYAGTNQVAEHTGLTPGQCYYYTIWVSDDGVTFVEPP